MRVRVDTDAVAVVLADVRAAADDARRLAAAARRLAADVGDATLSRGVARLGDASADVLEATGASLDRLLGAAHAGAVRYQRVEESIGEP